MSEVSERYTRLAGAFADKIAAVPDDKWSNQSPCDDWTARDVVNHVVGTQGMFLGFVGRSIEGLPSVDDDPSGAWAVASAAVQSDLDEPERANAEFDGMAGRTTFEAAVGRFLCTDLVVHGWDLARAVDLDEAIAPADMAAVREVCESFGPAMRSPGAFGEEVQVSDDADEQTKFIAFLGRTP
jgi:uncharacterized protein (TIGR03086 family)